LEVAEKKVVEAVPVCTLGQDLGYLNVAAPQVELVVVRALPLAPPGTLISFDRASFVVI
jgi:hypothetical protein